jgi:hypothetical protein
MQFSKPKSQEEKIVEDNSSVGALAGVLYYQGSNLHTRRLYYVPQKFLQVIRAPYDCYGGGEITEGRCYLYR